MRNLSHLNGSRISYMGDIGDERNGAFMLNLKGTNLAFLAVASDGAGWDHVSVSTASRCPRWEEMQQVKDLFFEPEEVVMQLHPARSEYINNFHFCLHMWRPQSVKIPTPPAILVGLKKVRVLGKKGSAYPVPTVCDDRRAPLYHAEGDTDDGRD